MVTNRILLFGGDGQVGNALQRLDLPANLQVGIIPAAACDFMQASAIAKAIRDFVPDLVINAAAMTDIAGCESDSDMARAINFHAVANIAAHCDTVAAPLIQVSTAFVFDGRDSVPYSPDDAMNPVNVYGQTIMMGEEAARHGLHWHVIVRTSLVFSALGENILTQTLRQIDTLEEVQAASDLIASPTSAIEVAEALLWIASAILNGKGNGFGTFHVASTPAVTRFEFLRAIMEAYAPFTHSRPKLVSVSSAELPDHALFPSNTSLNSNKVQEVYGIQPRDWRRDLVNAVREYAERGHHENR